VQVAARWQPTTVSRIYIYFEPSHMRAGPPAGAIAGGVVGGVAFLALCLFLVICFQRQRAPPLVKGWSSRDIEPFVTTPNPAHPGLVVSLSDRAANSHPAARRPKGAIVLSVPIRADHERMEREANELRQQVASLRAERVAAGSTATAPGRIDATETTAVRAPANSGLTHAEITRGLRREMAALREEIMRVSSGWAANRLLRTRKFVSSSSSFPVYAHLDVETRTKADARRSQWHKEIQFR